MTVGDLIRGLQRFPKEMEVVDADGYVFNTFRYRRIYDSQYPHKEIEHLALCLDDNQNFRPMNIDELKDIIKCQMYDYPDMYKDYKLTEDLLKSPKNLDTVQVYTEWEYAGENERNKPIFRLKDWHPYY